ncbi:hypothetical protein CC86DRAFT_379776 [Ophiobolus disseminans]|uniref:Uncharacterized protein n=1 Tax=Ophiobolus disseminans TaxID=1469910 RepID=A0A6A7A8E0_9PLEO|nr:hypothetical protein CC86DRAFT_379776 [Ophiobolus disseminans]
MEVPRLTKPDGQRADPELLENMLKSRRRHTKAPAPAQPQKRKNDEWEALGLAGIQKKKLSLDLNWTEATWTNKSTIFERLKLLKDDGVNITALQALEKPSVAISKAILAHIKVRKQQPRRLQPDVDQGFTSVDGSENIQVTPFDPQSDKSVCSSSHKRKRDDAQVEGSSETANPDGITSQDASSTKKVCAASPREAPRVAKMKVEEIPTWDELKRHVLDEILQASRSTRLGGSIPPPSCVTITFPLQYTMADSPSDLQLNSSGYACVMEELQVLADSINEDGTTTTTRILDPFVADTSAIIIHHTCNIFRNVPLLTMIEGNLAALIGFLSRTSTNGTPLAYMEKRFFDEAGARRDKGGNFELSDKTQQELKNVMGALEAGLEHGSVELSVSCYTKAGKKFGKKMDYKNMLY